MFAAERICTLPAELIKGIAVIAAIASITTTMIISIKVKPPLMPRKLYPVCLLKYEYCIKAGVLFEFGILYNLPFLYRYIINTYLSYLFSSS